MKIRILLALLCCVLCNVASYGQGFEGIPRRGMPKDELSQVNTRATGEYIMKEFPTMGEIKGVVILAAFADVPFAADSASINTLLSNRYNADEYSEEVKFEEYSAVYDKNLSLEVTIPGSARDYFRTQSMGQFVPQFDVIGPVTLDNPRAYYGENTKSGSDKNTGAMIREACQKAYDMGLTDFADYDNDGDGVVDVVYVVYAGSDEAQTGIKDCVWAKASTVTLTLGNGMKISRYACSGELVIDLPVAAGIGTFVHEFSHILGLPDFYNTKVEDFTMDVWSVLDYGMYNAEGFVPCGYTAFERYALGWIPMQTLEDPATLSIGTTDEEGRGYRIFTAKADTTSGVVADTTSFYHVETIRREGWNRYAPANGLLITEVTYDQAAWRGNTVNVGTHRHCVVPANNDYNYRTANKHLFGTVNHEFTLSSTPASITQFGVAMDKPLTDINYDAATGKTTFHFRGGKLTGGIDRSEIRNQQSETVYDLLGRPVKQTIKGLYIQNGEKYLAF